MRTLAVVSLSALLAVAASGPAPAQSYSYSCRNGIAATGRMANGLNFDPPRRYDTERAARSRAIAAWRQGVAARCPTHSTFWWRAHDKRVDCEGYAGGVACQVRAIPARKLLYFGAAD
jgi:hypothetical protein